MSAEERRAALSPLAPTFGRACALIGAKRAGGVHIWDARNVERQLVYLNPIVGYMGMSGIDI